MKHVSLSMKSSWLKKKKNNIPQVTEDLTYTMRSKILTQHIRYKEMLKTPSDT